MSKQNMPTFDCVIFSGGGAKGAYGAGAAKALFRFREMRNIRSNICWLGASAGALNAAVMAMFGVDKLLDFWREVTNRQVLDVWIKNQRFQATKQWLFRKLPYMRRPFSIYPNSGLRKLIEKKTDFKKLAGQHLIIAVTDYTVGRLKSFTCSDFFDDFKNLDDAQPEDYRRLKHWDRLTSEIFVEALLASCAIPLCFPPVEIQSSWYIDGGIGNNTPTREAAYFLRFLRTLGKGQPGEVFCIKLNPPRQRHDGPVQEGIFDITRRTIDVFHHLHTQPIINAWYRISTEVMDREKRIDDLITWTRGQTWSQVIVDSMTEKIQSSLESHLGPTSRIDVPLHIIEPSQELGDTLDFEMDIQEMIRAGHTDMLKTLRDAKRITQVEYDDLVDKAI